NNVDITLGNLPYQKLDGGYGSSAESIYISFVEKSRKISDFVSMIIPAKWYGGGDSRARNFRIFMINSNKIKKIHDFYDCKDVFTEVDFSGGVCYFIYDNNYDGKCLFKTKIGDAYYENDLYL